MGLNQFHHFGVPTSVVQDNETYVEGAKVYVTDPDSHPYRVEFLRFEADSPLPEVVRTRPHAAYVVENLDDAISDENVLIEPFDATERIRAAFIVDGEAIIELMEMRQPV